MIRPLMLALALPLALLVACAGRGAAPNAPTTPRGLAATPGDAHVTLVWQANTESDLTSYGVYQGSSAAAMSKVADIPAGTTSYTATSLTNGSEYLFALDAVNNAERRSPRSPPVAATPTVPPSSPSAPVPPGGLVVIPGDGRITLHWNANPEADLAQYGVYQSSSPETLRLVGDVAAGTTSYTATELTNGVAYVFALDAVNTAGQRSLRSPHVTAMPTAEPLPRCTLGSATLGACVLAP